MIATLSGVVKHIESSSVVIEVGGVGIVAIVPSRIVGSMVVGKVSSLHTSLVVREDSLTLYGFEDLHSRKLFETLQSATGIGPKVALSALNVYSAEEIAAAIVREDNHSLERIPGLGKKGVQRLIIELKEKIQAIALTSASTSQSVGGAAWTVQITEALTGLGFSAKQSNEAITAISEEFAGTVSQMPIGDLLKFALQIQGRNV